jgi:hypothetical protein
MMQVVRKEAAIDRYAVNRKRMQIQLWMPSVQAGGERKGLEEKVWRMMSWIFWPSGFRANRPR